MYIVKINGIVIGTQEIATVEEMRIIENAGFTLEKIR